jgi:hypothetical protein
MAQKQIKQFTEETAPVAGDMYLMQKASNDETVKVDAENVIPDATVVTAKIADGAVTPNKLSLGAAYDYVATSQTTTSTSYTDLATSGPAVTVTVGANGILLVSCFATLTNSGSAAQNVSFELSGANTMTPSDEYSGSISSGSVATTGRTVILTGLNPGATTVTAKYRVVAGTGTFLRRSISAVPL